MISHQWNPRAVLLGSPQNQAEASPSQFFAVLTSDFNMKISSSAYFKLEKSVGFFGSVQSK